MNVIGALALAVADLVELYAQCRHGGNNCGHNCPNCTVTKADRTNELVSVTAYDTSRSRSQTDCIVDSVQVYLETLLTTTYAGRALPRSVYDDIRREFGVVLGPSWFESVPFDEHRLGFRDGEHMFFFGIFKDFINQITRPEYMHPTTLRRFVARLELFEFPRGTTKLVVDYNKDRELGNRFGKGVSMSAYRQLALAVMFVLYGMVERRYFQHYCALYLWHLECMYMDKSVQTVTEIQGRGMTMVQQGMKLLPQVYDKPNGHALIEMIQRGLPLLVRQQFSSSGKFESHHRDGKAVLPSRHAIENALDLYNKRDTLRMCLRGAGWGPRRQYTFGSGIFTLRDLRDPNRPHPLISAITNLMPTSLSPSTLLPHAADKYHWNDGWVPSEWYRIDGKIKTAQPSSAIWSMIMLCVADLESGVDLKIEDCSFRYPRRIRRKHTDSSSLSIFVGDTISISVYAEPMEQPDDLASDQFAVVHEMILVKHPTTRFVVFIPHWYKDSRAGVPQVHRCFKTRVVTLSETPVLPEEVFSVGNIKEKVMPVHACDEACVLRYVVLFSHIIQGVMVSFIPMLCYV